MNTDSHRVLLLVVSAPSGAGKSTLCNRLAVRYPRLVYSISCTTRAPRGDERDGVHYYFLSEDEFCARIARGEFLEHATVHGNRYGTLKQTVYDALAGGCDIIMDIDVQGAQQIRDVCAQLPDEDLIRRSFVDIFIAPPSMEELQRRLYGRATDCDEVIAKRMRNAEAEMRQQPLYRYTVINGELATAEKELAEIIEREHHNR